MHRHGAQPIAGYLAVGRRSRWRPRGVGSWQAVADRRSCCECARSASFDLQTSKESWICRAWLWSCVTRAHQARELCCAPVQLYESEVSRHSVPKHTNRVHLALASNHLYVTNITHLIDQSPTSITHAAADPAHVHSHHPPASSAHSSNPFSTSSRSFARNACLSSMLACAARLTLGSGRRAARVCASH